MDNNFQAVIDWLMEYDQLKELLTFNVSLEDINTTSLNTITSETFETKWLRNGGIKNYDFAIKTNSNFDTSSNNINLIEFFDIVKFMEWIEIQNKIKNFPKFSNGIVFEILNLQNTPTLSNINTSENLAQYMFQIRIKYIVKGD